MAQYFLAFMKLHKICTIILYCFSRCTFVGSLVIFMYKKRWEIFLANYFLPRVFCLVVVVSSNLYFARVIPSIQTVLLSIGALEFKNLQYTFKNLLQPIYKMQGTFTNI